MSTILGVGQGRVMSVKNVGSVTIPANRFCLLADSGSDADDSPGIVVGISESIYQGGAGTIGAYAAVKSITGSSEDTGETGDVIGATAGAIKPGSVGTIIVEGPAVVEVLEAFDLEVGDPVQASSDSDASVGTAEAINTGVRVGMVLVKQFSTTAKTFDYNTGEAPTSYYAVIDIFNRTALGLETDTVYVPP